VCNDTKYSYQGQCIDCNPDGITENLSAKCVNGKWVVTSFELIESVTITPIQVTLEVLVPAGVKNSYLGLLNNTAFFRNGLSVIGANSQFSLTQAYVEVTGNFTFDGSTISFSFSSISTDDPRPIIDVNGCVYIRGNFSLTQTKSIADRNITLIRSQQNCLDVEFDTTSIEVEDKLDCEIINHEVTITPHSLISLFAVDDSECEPSSGVKLGLTGIILLFIAMLTFQ